MQQVEGLSARIAEHVATCGYERLPATTVQASKRAILDGLGVMLAASGESADVGPFVRIARQVGGAPEATLLGTGERVGAAMAAFANGALSHALDYEDAFDAAPTHPNASLLPVAFALAESRGRVSGREFIAAVAVGCDLVCRMALALRQPMEAGGWYPPPILGAYGATAAAARLLRLSSRQVMDAFSLMLAQNSCPGEIKYSPDSVLRAVREAFPAQAAVQCAMLAAEGVRGFDQPLEGKAGFYQLFAGGKYSRETLLEGLGRSFWIEQLSFKRWPCCRGTHAYIEAAQQLRKAHGFRWQDITSIRLGVGEVHRMLCEPVASKRAPQTLIDAKFSLPFTVAVALVEEEVTLGSFTQAALSDERLLGLAAISQSVDWRSVPEYDAAAGELTLEFAGGRELHCHIDRTLGDPTRPLGEDALREKFIDCAGRATVPLAQDQARQLAARIAALETEDDVGALLRAFL